LSMFRLLHLLEQSWNAMIDISCFNLLSSQLFTNLLQIPADSLITIDYDLDSDAQNHILYIVVL